MRVAPARLRHTTDWLKALVSFAPDGLAAYVTLEPGAWANGLTLITDSSPWGFGGFLSYHGYPVAWIAGDWGNDDLASVGLRAGDHRD